MLGVVGMACAGGCQPRAGETEAALPPPGASWTRERQPERSFIAPAAHLDAEGQLGFYTGFSFFRSPWVAAPASTTARDGLGPLFNAHSCAGCHPNGGRGRSLLDDPHSTGMSVRVGALDAAGNAKPHPRYGEQLQTRATFRNAAGRMAAEARVAMTAATTADGLRQPMLRIVALDDDAGEEPLLASARVAPALLGLGLLESVAAADLLRRADPDDANGDGISGRVHLLRDGRIGRFGWKASRATVAEQTAAAFSEDLGITTTRFPHTTCTSLQKNCLRQPHGGGQGDAVELPDPLFEQVRHFVAHIPPPAAGPMTPEVDRGRRIFAALGCASCHAPSHHTPAGEIWPYTDLLLHDMGERLAEQRPEGDAKGHEWRTPPLWGIGALSSVSGRPALLHDGRARDLDEAIRWHGGEAADARTRYGSLKAAQRKALLAFLRAI